MPLITWLRLFFFVVTHILFDSCIFSISNMNKTMFNSIISLFFSCFCMLATLPLLSMWCSASKWNEVENWIFMREHKFLITLLLSVVTVLFYPHTFIPSEDKQLLFSRFRFMFFFSPLPLFLVSVFMTSKVCVCFFPATFVCLVAKAKLKLYIQSVMNMCCLLFTSPFFHYFTSFVRKRQGVCHNSQLKESHHAYNSYILSEEKEEKQSNSGS